jgi:hypothetical protein
MTSLNSYIVVLSFPLFFLGQVQRPSMSRLRADTFTENPPLPPDDDPAVVSRKDDGGSCSQALSSSLGTVARSIDGVIDPVRKYGAKIDRESGRR